MEAKRISEEIKKQAEIKTHDVDEEEPAEPIDRDPEGTVIDPTNASAAAPVSTAAPANNHDVVPMGLW